MILATSRGKTTADVRWCLLLAIFVALILLNLCLSVSSFHTIPHRKCRAFHPSPSLQRHWFRKRASRRFSVGCSDSIAYRRPLHVAFAIGRSGADDADQIEKRDSDQEMVSHRGDETINSEGRRLQPDNNEQKSRRVSFQGSNESRADGVSVTEAAHAPFSAKCMAKGIPGGNGTGNGGLGQYNPADKLPGRKEQVLVGDPQQKREEKEMSVTSILKELSAIQEQGPQKYCVLGTRHCSYLHQRIIELL